MTDNSKLELEKKTKEAVALTMESAGNAFAIAMIDRFGHVIVRYGSEVKVSQNSGHGSVVLDAVAKVMSDTNHGQEAKN